MKNAMLWTAVGLAAMALASPAMGQDKVALKMLPAVGSYLATTTVESENTSNAAGTEQKQTMTMSWVMKMTVAEGDKGGRKIEVSLDKIKQAMKGAGMEMEYDSAGPADKNNENLDKAFKPLLGAKATVTMNADGEVTDVKGLESVFEGPGANPMAGAIKTMFGDKALKMHFEEQKAFLPAKPVAAGDSYEGKSVMPVPIFGEMNVTYQCKVASLDNGVATIDVTGKATKDKATTQMGPASMTISDMRINQTGQMKFDSKLGMFTSGDMKQDMAMTMNMTVGEKEMQSTVKQTAKVKTTVEAAK